MATATESTPDQSLIQVVHSALERRGLLWRSNFLLVVAALVAYNSWAHQDYASGLVFLVLSILILLVGRIPSEQFFGTSSIAVYLVLHITLFGANQFALITAFAVFIVASPWLLQNTLGPFSVYLLLDAIFVQFGTSIPSDLLQDWGTAVFEGPLFWFVVTALPSFMLFLWVDKYLLDTSFSQGVREYGVFYLLIFVALLLGGLARLLSASILEWAMSMVCLVYIAGLFGVTTIGKHGRGRRSFRKAVVPAIIATAVLLLVQAFSS